MYRIFRPLFFICCLLSAFSLIKGQADEFWKTSKGGYNERKQIFLEYHVRERHQESLYGIFTQISRVETGLNIENNELDEALAIMRTNRDCNDFIANGLLRLMYLDKKKVFFSKSQVSKIDEHLLEFKYWWNDSRRDTTYRCYHTENHQALYHTAELLAGQLHKEKIFADGETGLQHMEHAKELLNRWLDFRFRFGFSEWLSSYYDADIMLLCNLYDFAEDEVIRRKAETILNLIFYDLALNNFHGILGSTSGRIYVSSLLYGSHDMSPILKLVFGEGVYLTNGVGIMGITALVSSNYKCPTIIQQIATDYNKSMINRQKMSINVEEAHLYNLSYDDELNCHLFWGMQEFIHPNAIRLSKKISEKYDVWPYRNYDDYIKKYEEQIAKFGEVQDLHLDRFALSEANIETYRTHDYMLSCVQDYRKGAPGYQQHIWQATLGNKAIVYTNHPGSKNLRTSPNYWAGNPILPRAAQHKNVLVCIYNISDDEETHASHAYFPKDEFDEIIRQGNWSFARKGDAYIGLYSHNETKWETDDKGILDDLYAEGRQNIWICEMGSAKDWTSFEKFVSRLSSVSIISDGQNISYQSPSLNKVEFGWNSPFKVNGKNIPLRYDFRYDNIFSRTPFDSQSIQINRGVEFLDLR